MADRRTGVLYVGSIQAPPWTPWRWASTNIVLLPAGVRPGASRAFLAADGATTALLWLVLTGAVVLVALTATWYLGSMAIDGLLTMATRCVR